MKKSIKNSAKKNIVKKSNVARKAEKQVRGNNMHLTPAEWKLVDAKLKKEGLSFSKFSRNLVLRAINKG